MKDADVRDLLCLQDDLSPREGCKDRTSLQYWKSLSAAELRKRWQARQRHVGTAITAQRAILKRHNPNDGATRARANDLLTMHEHINGLWSVQNHRSIKSTLEEASKVPMTRPGTWFCCPECTPARVDHQEATPAAPPASVSHETHDDTNSGAISRCGPEPNPIPIPHLEHTPEPDGIHRTQDGEHIDSVLDSQDAPTPHRDSTPALPANEGTSIANGSPLDSEPRQALTVYQEYHNTTFTPPASINCEHGDSQDDVQDEGEHDGQGGHKESEQGVDDSVATRRAQRASTTVPKAPTTVPPKVGGSEVECAICGTKILRRNRSRHEQAIHYRYSCGRIGSVIRHGCSNPAKCSSIERIDTSRYVMLGLLDDLGDSLKRRKECLTGQHLHNLHRLSKLVAEIRLALERHAAPADSSKRNNGKTIDVSQAEGFARPPSSETGEFHNGELDCQLHSLARGRVTETGGGGAIQTSNEQEPRLHSSRGAHSTALMNSPAAGPIRSASILPSGDGLSTTSRSMPSRQAPAKKRKRNESEPSTDSGVTSEKEEDRDAVESEGATIFPVSSQIRDPRASRNDSVPDIPRVSSPSIQVELAQHAANAQHGAIPPEDLDRASSHPESLDHGTAETFSAPAMPNQAQPNVHYPRGVTESIADAQSEHPPISTNNELPCQTSLGDIAPGSVLIQGDSHSVRDTSAPLTHHTPNHPGYASSSGISQPDTSSAEMPAIGVTATDERAPTLYTSLSQSTDLIMGGADVAAPPPLTKAIHSPPIQVDIVAATSGQPLPPQSSEKGIPTSLPMPINSDSTPPYAATAGHLLDGDRRPNKRQRIPTGDIEFSVDSGHSTSTPQFAHYSTPGYSSTGFADFPVTRAVGLEHSLHSQTAVAQVPYFKESTASHPHRGFPACGLVSYESSGPGTALASGYSLPALTAPDHGYQQGLSVKDMIANECNIATTHHPPSRVTLAAPPRSNWNSWQDVTLDHKPSLTLTKRDEADNWPGCNHSALDTIALNGQRPSFAYGTSGPAAVEAVLGSDLFARIERSYLRMLEKRTRMQETKAVTSYEYEKHWVIALTLHSSEGPDESMNALKDRIANAIEARSEERERMVIQKLLPSDGEGDYWLACTMDKMKGNNMVRSLHDLNSLLGPDFIQSKY
jgi:hypothetical protein